MNAQENFVTKSSVKHGSFYSYSNVYDVNSRTPVFSNHGSHYDHNGGFTILMELEYAGQSVPTVMLTNCVVDNKQTIKAKDYYHNLLDVIPYSEHNSTWKRRLYNHVNLSKQIQ